MAPFRTKVVALMVVALPSLMLLLMQPSTVEAVGFIGYSDTGCSGTIINACLDVGPDVCCGFVGDGREFAASIEILDLLSGESVNISTADTPVLCTEVQATIGGPKPRECYYNSLFEFYTGAKWYYNDSSAGENSPNFDLAWK